MAREYARGDLPSIAIGIGMPLGAALAMALGDPVYIGVGVALGAGTGIAIGSAMEANLKRKGRIRSLTPAEKRVRRRFAVAGLVVGALLFVAIVAIYFISR